MQYPPLGIDIWRLEPEDRGRKVVVTIDGESCPTELRNWNERYLFLAHLGTNHGGHCDPALCRWFDEDRDLIQEKETQVA